MACEGYKGDYLCAGWRIRAETIRARDGNRCRVCDRHADTIPLHVHHRRYGEIGQCGNCVLTGITDNDLLTLCVECHEAGTNIRHAIRHAVRVVDFGTVGSPPAAVTPIRAKVEVTFDLTPAPVPARPVVRSEKFNPVW